MMALPADREVFALCRLFLFPVNGQADLSRLDILMLVLVGLFVIVYYILISVFFR